MLECTNGPLMLFSFCIVQFFFFKSDILLRYLHNSSHKLYLLLFLEIVSHCSI